MNNEFEQFEDLEYSKSKEIERHSNGKKVGFSNSGIDKLIIKKRAYSLYADGYLTQEINQILMEEFNLKKATIYNYTKELKDEFRENNAAELDELRIWIIASLRKDIREAKTYWERSDARKDLIKITGLGSETLNVNQESNTVITTYEIVTRKENEDDKPKE